MCRTWRCFPVLQLRCALILRELNQTFIAYLFKGGQEQFFFLQTPSFTAFLVTVLKILTYALVSTWSSVSSGYEHVPHFMPPWTKTAAQLSHGGTKALPRCQSLLNSAAGNQNQLCDYERKLLIGQEHTFLRLPVQIKHGRKMWFDSWDLLRGIRIPCIRLQFALSRFRKACRQSGLELVSSK